MEEKLLEEWQERLGLNDWAICLRYNCKQEDLADQGAVGETEWQVTIKSAWIRIISKEEYGDRMLDFDFEKTLVHELLHLKFATIDLEKDTYESEVLEVVRHQLIDDLARALVMAKRGKTKWDLASNTPKVLDNSNNCGKKEEVLSVPFDDTAVITTTINDIPQAPYNPYNPRIYDDTIRPTIFSTTKKEQ